MLCLVKKRRFKKRREGGLSSREEEIPTSEEELAEKTEEGWPETQGSPGKVSDSAARNTWFKGQTVKCIRHC